MKNKRKRDTTVNLSDWDIETRMGYLTRHSEEKVEGETNGIKQIRLSDYIPVGPYNSLNLLFGIFRTRVWNHV